MESNQLKVVDPSGSTCFLVPRTKKYERKSDSENLDSLFQKGPQDGLFISDNISTSNGGTFARETSELPPGWFMPPVKQRTTLPSSYSTSMPSSFSEDPQRTPTDILSASIAKTVSTIIPQTSSCSSITSNCSSSSQSYSPLKIETINTSVSPDGSSVSFGTFAPGSKFKRFQVLRGSNYSNQKPRLIPLVDESLYASSSESQAITTSEESSTPLSRPLKPLIIEKTLDKGIQILDNGSIPLVDESLHASSSESQAITTPEKSSTPLSRPLKPLIIERTLDKGFQILDNGSIPHLTVLGLQENQLGLEYFDVSYSCDASKMGKYTLKCDPLSKTVQVTFPDGAKRILKSS
jgi:hypothetical protein